MPRSRCSHAPVPNDNRTCCCATGTIPSNPTTGRFARQRIRAPRAGLIEALGYVPEMRERLEEQRHAAAVRIAAAFQDPLQLAGCQQEMFNQLFARVRRLERWIVLAQASPPRISDNWQNRQCYRTAISARCGDEVDSTTNCRCQTWKRKFSSRGDGWLVRSYRSVPCPTPINSNDQARQVFGECSIFPISAKSIQGIAISPLVRAAPRFCRD